MVAGAVALDASADVPVLVVGRVGWRRRRRRRRCVMSFADHDDAQRLIVAQHVTPSQRRRDARRIAAGQWVPPAGYEAGPTDPRSDEAEAGSPPVSPSAPMPTDAVAPGRSTPAAAVEADSMAEPRSDEAEAGSPLASPADAVEADSTADLAPERVMAAEVEEGDTTRPR